MAVWWTSSDRTCLVHMPPLHAYRGFVFIDLPVLPKCGVKVNSPEKYMALAIAEAAKDEGFTSPNPPVGAVIVKNGKVIATGYHRGPGLPHAEADALQKAGSAASGADMYVTLEPCNHQGRTPPCSQAIVDAGIKQVFYAVADPNPAVTGGGHAMLEKNGLRVQRGIGASRAEEQMRFYLHAVQHKTPYVIAKFAASLDGKTATAGGESKWITGPEARREGHRLRAQVDAIAVGAQTALLDNPSLTARLDREVRQPLRIVLDSKGRVPLESHLFNTSKAARTLVVTTKAMPHKHRAHLANRQVQVLTMPAKVNGQIDEQALLTELGKMDIQSLLLEGGSTLLGSFFETNQVQEVYAFLAPKIIGGATAPGAVGGTGIHHLSHVPVLKNLQTRRLGDDILITAQIGKE